MISVANTIELSNLVCRCEHYLNRRFPFSLGFIPILLKSTNGVLDDDNRIIDQRPECDGHTTQRHRVQTAAEPPDR